MIDRDVLWVWLHAADGVGRATANDLWVALAERDMDLEDFFSLDETRWAAEFGLNARAVSGLAASKARLDETRQLVDALRESNVQLIALDGPDYPATLKVALGRQTPALLYAWGNVELLARQGAAVVGARDASERGLHLARLIGGGLARNGLVVVSGGARGVDSEAHGGALAAGGATVVVLGCGILRFHAPAGLREAADAGTILYLSEQPPAQTWEAGGAMQRNRIVCALASALIVVEAGTSGGTLHAAKKGFDLRRQVFVVRFDSYDAHSAGNPALLRSGARPLKATWDGGAESWHVDLAPVMAAADRQRRCANEPQQPDLLAP
jgi:DNA processing protein